MNKQPHRGAVPHTMSVTQLSQNASGAVDRAIELGDAVEPLMIMRHNKPVAVLMGIDAYEKLHAGYIENETEIVIDILAQKGIAREDIPAWLERQKTGPWHSFDEVLAMTGTTREELQALAEEYGDDL